MIDVSTQNKQTPFLHNEDLLSHCLFPLSPLSCSATTSFIHVLHLALNLTLTLALTLTRALALTLTLTLTLT